MTLPAKPPSPDLRLRKIMGRTYLHENRLEEALDTFVAILRDHPEDVDALMTLGNLYLAAGNGRTAEQLYRRALAQDPQNQAIAHQIELSKEERSLPEEAVPTNRAAIARLLQRLTGRPSAISEAEIERAADLLQLIMHSSQPAELVAHHLDEIDNLLPALLELNIRQARADGRPELADALQNLQVNIGLQLSGKEETPIEENAASSVAEPAFASESNFSFKGTVWLLAASAEELTPRLQVMARGLRSYGCDVRVVKEVRPDMQHSPDILIAGNPHLNPDHLESLVVCRASGIPILVDLDMDFENLPVYHKDYAAKGLGSADAGRAYTAALLMANLITVPSDGMAESLRAAGHPTAIVPEGWDGSNSLWEQTTPEHLTVNLGWVGVNSSLEDLFSVRRVIIRVLHEFPNTQMVVIGNSQAYKLFETLPENRRKYLPVPAADVYPYLLSQMDILLLPFRSHPFTQTQSDRLLVEAGLKRIPWVASPVPAFTEWKAGGFIANSLDEWHTCLRQLMLDTSLRKSLGQAGYDAAQSRDESSLARRWMEVVEQVQSTVPALAYFKSEIEAQVGDQV